LPDRGPPGPLMVFVFRTARILRAHDHEARWKRAVRKSMSGPGGPRSGKTSEHLHHVDPGVRIEAVVGWATPHDLEAVPAVEANVGLGHLGGLERQAAEAA